MYHAPIPFVDLRGKTPVDLLRAYPDRACDMLRATRRMFGMASDALAAGLLPLADRASHRWLRRTRSPYLYEIESFAEILRTPGVYSLNLSFEWGCTTGVWRMEDSYAMLRVLDWPFPALGKHLMITLQQGSGGLYYNLTWPGLCGVFTSMAPGRFSAAVNLAPMRKLGLSLPGDWIAGRIAAWREEGLPPAHLLRRVCDSARDYQDAKEALCQFPLAVPAIFTLAGTQPGEGVIIERTEREARMIDIAGGLQISTANHFTTDLKNEGKGWRPREIDSAGRFRQSCNITSHDLEAVDFKWLTAPIINERTRLCMIGDAKRNHLHAQGYEGLMPVTSLFSLESTPIYRQQVV